MYWLVEERADLYDLTAMSCVLYDHGDLTIMQDHAPLNVMKAWLCVVNVCNLGNGTAPRAIVFQVCGVLVNMPSSIPQDTCKEDRNARSA